jgi:cytochrome c oxidase cbb3-type subunit III
MSLGEDKEKLDVKEDEKHLLLDHNYDNIHELNHPLPSWWNVIFTVSVIYGTGYFFYYQVFGGPTLKDEFRTEYGRVLAAQAEFKRLNGVFNQSFYEDILKADGVTKGKAVYELNCMPCHMENGIGDVGPNLTDKHWIIAKGTPETLHHVVFHGSEANGMPAWGELITKEEIYQSVAYVMTFKNLFLEGKEPQGEIVED